MEEHKMPKTNDLQGKRLLLLGGVRQSCEIIKEAKNMGVETFVTSRTVTVQE